MAAKRKLNRIIIRIDPTTGIPIDIEAQTQVTVTENQLRSQGRKIYAIGYVTLSVEAQARLDRIILDVEEFMDIQEPIR